MSDAEDTEAIPTTTETTLETVTPTNDITSPEDIPITVPSAEIKNPSRQEIESLSNVLSEHQAVGILDNINKDGEGSQNDKKEGNESKKTETKKIKPCPPPQSRCRAQSRDMRQCKKHFREMIGKHEIRNDELEQRETDLRQRLEMLECSMPAVMVWNIWRMAQGAPVSHLRDIVEKQFLEPPGGFAACPSRPSQHWDCRVREVEAERKQALHRAEEARQVFAVKGDALKFQKQQIQEAKMLQEERKMQITKLEEEVKRLQDALKKAQGDENSCETGECGEIQCRKMWLQGVSSVSSIHSTDLECLARLQDLAEAELCMKRQIADLERRECAYMRTLQQADEMWAKMEDDNASNLGDLKEQLDAKIAANQQLADRIVELEDEIEKLRTQLAKALAMLDEYNSKTFVDIGFGDANISTKEKIEQTEDEESDSKALKEGRIENLIITETPELSEPNVVTETEEIQQLQKKESDETQEQMQITGEIKQDIKEPQIRKLPTNQEIQITKKISNADESVEAKPDTEDAETQSTTKIAGLEKETATEDRTQMEAATITEVIGGKKISNAVDITPEVSREHSSGQQWQETISKEVLKAEAKHVYEPTTGADSSYRFEDNVSLTHLLETPMEDKNSGIAMADNQKETFEAALEAATEQISRISTGSSHNKASETTIKTISGLNDEIFRGKTSRSALMPVAKVSDEAVPVPVIQASSESTTHVFSKPVIGDTPITTAKLLEKPIPQPVSEIDPEGLPSSTIDDTFGLVPAPTIEPATNTVPIPTPESVVEAVEESILKPTLEVIVPTQIDNSSSVPIQTLLSWHNITACLQKQISICPQCSLRNDEVGRMLEEIRSYLGKDAPDLAKIECAKVSEEVKNSVSLPTKKGPCICKPKTCPLNGTPAATPAQANVQMQTIIDGQSQTSMPVKDPSREIRSSKSSKGSTKSKEEVKLTSIEEGTEPEPETRRAKSIPEARDEATVTVDDIASQTEATRKVSSLNKEREEELCVCPTGVCPKKKVKSSCGECIPGKICSSQKKAVGKEYKSTADAILAPAIRVLPSNENVSSPTMGTAKADDIHSVNSAFACCMCGKPLTPVPSRKTTSIPMPTKSVLRSKIMLASDGPDDEFLCCSCKAKDSHSSRPKHSSPSKSSERFSEKPRVSHRVKPSPETLKTSCSREICCSCDNQEIHVLTKTLTTELEVSKSKTKPETKDVCCLAKISRDKSSKTEARRRKDKDSIRSASSSISHTGSGQVSSCSSTYNGSKINDSSSSNVCCSSIEQVTNMTKKKGKGTKCACDGQNDKDNKKGCVCGEDNEPTLSKQGKNIEPSVSCLCPPKLFDN